MRAVIEILNVVMPVFLVIGLGYLLARHAFLSAGTVRELSRFVFYVAAPALLFRDAAHNSLSESLDLRAILAVVAISICQAAAFYFVFFRSAPARRGVLAQGTFRSNLVFVGYPVIVNALGQRGLGMAAVYVGFITVLYNFIAVFLLTLPHRAGNGEKLRLLPLARSVVTNPLIIACTAGILVSLLPWQMPVTLDRALKLGADISTPLALIVVGASLDLSRFRAELKPALLVSSLKLLVYPALNLGALYALGLRGIALEVPILLLCSPTAVVSQVMAREMKGDAQLASGIVVGSTLLSLFTISAWLAFFQWLG